MEYKTKALAGWQIKSAPEGRVEAVFSTFGVIDHDGDVLLPGAFTDGAPVRISAYGHESWKGALPVGKGLIRTTAREAILEGQLFLNTTAGRDTFEVIKQMGDLQEWSYSLRGVEAEKGSWNGQPARIIRAVDVHEVSPVLMGASIDTRTLAVKGHPDFDRAELLRIRDRIVEEQRGELTQLYLRFLKSGVDCRASASTGDPEDFRPVPTATIPSRTLAAASRATKASAAHLGINTPTMYWFSQKKCTLLGRAFRGEGEIWLNCRLGEGEVGKVAAHEVAHCKGFDEHQAQAYEVLYQLEVAQ
jgi:hypothetical protein